MIKAVIFDMYETLMTLYESPQYFSEEIAADAKIPVGKFQSVWRGAEDDRTVGKISLEEILERILRENGVYSDELLKYIVEKRIRIQKEAYRHLHREIIPMLDALKEKGILIGLISNCFSEEAEVIKNSIFYPYFDAPCLSYEEKIKKPDPKIFKRCIEKLDVNADECLYVGDGGSFELETAEKVGMNTAQAVWYLKENTHQPASRKPEFRQAETPMVILKIIETL